MISRIHSKLGTAGFIISIVALVAALGGGAYAAKQAGLNGKQKNEVKKIAQTEAKKIVPVPGPPGAPGAAGAKGDTGGTGAAGTNGTNGTNGKDGTSVTTASFTGKKTVGSVTCEEGGVEVKSASPATAVCTGSPWPAGGKLPPEKTLTGIVGGGVNFTASEVKEAQQISFNLPLSAAPTINLIQKNGTANPGNTANCPGTAAAPAANPGNLCVYVDPDPEVTIGEPAPTLSSIKAYSTGAVIQANYPPFSAMIGTWAVTAPAA